MSAQHSPRDADFFDGGWCWMTHPDWNIGNAVPVKMYEADGTRFYIPLDPSTGTEYEWDKRDDEWQIIVPALASTLVIAAPDLLEAARAAMLCIGELSPTQARVEVAQMLTAAIAKATGSAA